MKRTACSNSALRSPQPAKRIVIGEGVRLTEGPLDLVGCFNPERNTCQRIAPIEEGIVALIGRMR